VHALHQRLSKLLIWLHFHIFPGGMYARFGCSNREHQPDLHIRSQSGFHPLGTGRQQGGSFRRLLGHFEGDLGGYMERGRDCHGTSMIGFRQSCRCDKGVVRLTIGLE